MLARWGKEVKGRKYTFSFFHQQKEGAVWERVTRNQISLMPGRTIKA